MNRLLCPDSLQPLPAALQALANAQARVLSAENQLALLAEQHPSVQAYLAVEQQRQTAKADAKRARSAVSAAALSQFDGRHPIVCDDVQIANRADVNVIDDRAALLWLVCYQPEALDLAQPEQLLAALRREGLQNTLCVSRTRLLEAVAALFARPAIKVCGWMAVEGCAEPLWRHVVVPDAADAAAARQVVEARLSAEIGNRAWCWAQEPVVTPTVVHRDYLTVSEPMTVPYARIRQDLSHLVTEQPQPLTYVHCSAVQEDTS